MNPEEANLALSKALASLDLLLMKEAIQEGADVNSITTVKIFGFRKEQNNVTALTAAVLNFFYYDTPIDFIEALLKAGANPNLGHLKDDYRTEYPLHSMMYINSSLLSSVKNYREILVGMEQVAKLLIGHGADPSIAHTDGRTFLHNLMIPLKVTKVQWACSFELLIPFLRKMVNMKNALGNNVVAELGLGANLWGNTKDPILVCQALIDMGAEFSAEGSRNNNGKSFEEVMIQRELTSVWRAILPNVAVKHNLSEGVVARPRL